MTRFAKDNERESMTAYHYATIRIERGAWRTVAAAVGNVYGLWRGEIGWYSDEGAVMSTAPLASPIEGVISISERSLAPTVRPARADPPTEDGIYAHRWFEVATDHFEEFLELSEGAWPSFESTFGVRIVGLWRDLEAPAGTEHALLITRYPSLAVWESSRPYSADQTPRAEEARRRFVRRAELTVRTGVRVGRLVT
jgi:hypothetical protein